MTDLAHDRRVHLCADLKLHGVADSCAALAAAAAEQGQSFTDYFEAFLRAERDFRRARSAATMLRMAGFPAAKTLEGHDFTFASSAPKRQIGQLAALPSSPARRMWCSSVRSLPLAPARPRSPPLAIVLGPMADNGSPWAGRSSPSRSATGRPAPGSGSGSPPLPI